MYRYRKLSKEKQQELVRYRVRRNRPQHSPPHPEGDVSTRFLLTGACFEHRPILSTEARRIEWSEKLLERIDQAGGEPHAWIVLPNHWHVLATIRLNAFRPLIAKLNNGTSTQFNREDNRPGRKVWHQYSDRRIRNQQHYFASLNYVHANAVKHGYVEKAQDWPHSSFDAFLERFGRDIALAMWSTYPVREYGAGWDW